ncbi:hypothetical protein STEG23_012441, partial [Scotinomys teguina]
RARVVTSHPVWTPLGEGLRRCGINDRHTDTESQCLQSIVIFDKKYGILDLTVVCLQNVEGKLFQLPVCLMVELSGSPRAASERRTGEITPVLSPYPYLSPLESCPSYILGPRSTGRHHTTSFNLVDLSIGWNLPSSAFCKAGFVDRYCSNLVLSWNVLFTPSMLVFSSFFYSFYSYVGPFHGVPDFLDILFYDLFGFGVFLDCRIYFLY